MNNQENNTATEKILQALNNGEWVNASARYTPDIATLLDRCADACFRLNSLPPSAKPERLQVIKSLLGSCAEGIIINSPFRCDFGFNIHIGRNFIGNFNLAILDEARVSIGDNVMIGPNCSIITITHALDAGQRNDGVMAARPVSIGNNVWIAANVTILPGVSIGDNSIIGAGSVVNKDIPENTLAFGAPCKPIRAITEADRIANYIS